ncbi:hypothetical protein BP5796_09720 [Coleophoma crateriformis]|uniref:Arrestin-like N-terminal domain-containing protein n=1 Tax=Coleophoma crateriformis TaxID=565419 RepID=A0A3D8QZ83_9HELO|nr:hypothetical protein BP5796_09720 [Coleophoma crateriformis]
MSNSLNIILDRHGSDGNSHAARPHLFIPGERVTGKVVLTLEEDTEISAVVIRFRGKCKTQVPHNEDVTISHKFFMFAFEKRLFEGPFTLEADTHEWPFSFTFPEHYEMKGNPFRGIGCAGMSKPPTRRLPMLPSMSMHAGETEAHVQYKLQARVPRSFVDWKSKVTLHLTPVRLEALPDPHVISRKQVHAPWTQLYRYSENFVPRPLSSKEKFKSKFHAKADNRSITFSFSASAPTAIVIGRPYPVTITLNTEPTDMVIPTFILHTPRAHLDAHTNLCVPGSFHDHKAYKEQSIGLNNISTTNFEMPPNKPVTLKHVFPKMLHAPPTFSSLSLARKYGLSIHFKITMLDEKFDVVCKFPEVTLFAAKMEDGVEEAINAMNQAAPRYEGPSDGPPTYNL